ncbi:MAG: isoprenylcysteine carboxylmethyltransferase family protein [Minisyncoccia bacterium]|jgi:protein-S-isoprenylcysteine O-methyltransferase Ste14
MTEPDSPHVVAIPPFVFLGGFFIALILQWLLPVHVFSGIAWKTVGWIVALISGILALSGFRAMHRIGTNIDVRKPALAIVSTGPFRYTRNPLYLSLVLLYIGIALFFDMVWLLAILVPIVLVIHYGVIRREERYLEGKFGESYLEYKKKVRRWV